MSLVHTRGVEAPPGYVIHGLLGQGGFAKVWEAAAPDGRLVALKYLPCLTRQGGIVSNEIRRLLNFRDVQHPHLIQLYNVFAGSEHLIVSMERADATLQDLDQAYQQEFGTHVSPEHLCELLEQSAQALDFIASQPGSSSEFSVARLQHCDIKPTNLLMLNDRIKVADFGLCAQQLSGRGEFRGTPPFAAPELYTGKISGRIDQYALAITYCKLRGGEFPFTVSDPNTNKHQQYAPDLSMLPTNERAPVARALELNWLDRWPTCQDFTAALKKSIGIEKPKKRSGVRRREPASWAGLAAK